MTTNNPRGEHEPCKGYQSAKTGESGCWVKKVDITGIISKYAYAKTTTEAVLVFVQLNKSHHMITGHTSTAACLVIRGDVFNKVHNTVAVSVLVIVPRDQFHESLGQLNASGRVED